MPERQTIVPGEDDPVTVDYDYQPYEAQTLEYPGCREEVTLNRVLIHGTWVDASKFSHEWRQEAEASILADIHEDNEASEPDHDDLDD